MLSFNFVGKSTNSSARRSAARHPIHHSASYPKMPDGTEYLAIAIFGQAKHAYNQHAIMHKPILSIEPDYDLHTLKATLPTLS